MRYKHNQNDLEIYWDEHLRFIEKSSEDYDKGDYFEAKRIATSLRVLFNQTSKSNSLFNQLKEKQLRDGFLFLSSTGMYVPANLTSSFTLISLCMENGEAKYKPKGLDNEDLHLLSFEDWWNEIIFDDKAYKLTRRDIISFISNQDGGAHVDPSLDERYSLLVKFNSLGWIDEKGEAINGNPAYVAIRQIADEIIASNNIFYKKIYRREKCINREFEMIFMDMYRRFPWVISNDENLLDKPYRREKRKAYIQKYVDGTRLPLLIP